MKSKKACGWILVSPQNRILLLQNTERGDWGLPKGHMEKGESELETALRELEEETGLSQEHLLIDQDFSHELSYSFVKKSGQRILKHSLYFKAQCFEESVMLSKEHSDFLWASTPQITTKITYNGCRQMLLETLNG